MMCTPSVILLRRKGRRERREMHGEGKEEEGGGKEKYIEGAEGRGRRKDSEEGGERERKKREEGGLKVAAWTHQVLQHTDEIVVPYEAPKLS